jgi:hypothetical protein
VTRKGKHSALSAGAGVTVRWSLSDNLLR